MYYDTFYYVRFLSTNNLAGTMTFVADVESLPATTTIAIAVWSIVLVPVEG
jgi:hypothetical protein